MTNTLMALVLQSKGCLTRRELIDAWGGKRALGRFLDLTEGGK